MKPRLARPAVDECSRYYFTYIQLVPDGDIVRTLQTQHAEMHDLLKDMTETKAMASPAPGEWSAKQVLLHLSDTERLFCFRALWFARGGGYRLAVDPGAQTAVYSLQSFGTARSQQLNPNRSVQARNAVILGCTEFPLLISEADSPLPRLDSTRLLAHSALRAEVRQ